jgi:3-hydroxyacyl-CoA dehydrogenase
VFTLEQGLGTAEDIDAAAKLGLNHPMGPLELSDFIGLDTVLAIADVLHREFGDDKYRAPGAAAQLRGRGLARAQDRPRLLPLRQEVTDFAMTTDVRDHQVATSRATSPP